MLSATARRPRVPQPRTWTPSPGDIVEIRSNNASPRTGRVEEVMPDGSGFWLEPYGPDERRYICLKDENLAVWA